MVDFQKDISYSQGMGLFNDLKWNIKILKNNLNIKSFCIVCYLRLNFFPILYLFKVFKYGDKRVL